MLEVTDGVITGSVISLIFFCLCCTAGQAGREMEAELNEQDAVL